MRIKVNHPKVIYVLLVILVLNVNYSLLYLKSDYYYFLIAVLAMLSALALIVNIKIGGTYKLLIKGAKSFVFPWAIVTSVSIAIISCVLCVYFFDNMITSFGYNITIFLIWFALIDREIWK